MGLYRICQHCGHRLMIGEKCECKAAKDREATRQKFYDQKKRNKESKAFYNSIRWRAMRAEVMAAAYGLDEVEFSNGRGVKGDLIHHIYPLSERPDLALDLSNLICVNAETHAWIHREYKTRKKAEVQQMLLELAAARNRRHMR